MSARKLFVYCLASHLSARLSWLTSGPNFARQVSLCSLSHCVSSFDKREKSTILVCIGTCGASKVGVSTSQFDGRGGECNRSRS